MLTKLLHALPAAALVLAFAACGDDDEDADADNTAQAADDTTATEDESGGAGEDSGENEGPTTGGGGTVTVAGETFELDGANCFLEETQAAGQTIEFTATGSGDGVLADATRFGDDAAVAGDSVSITVGESTYSRLALPGRDTHVFTLEGETVTGSDIPLTEEDTGEEVTASFEIDC